ncbi:MAG: shikimate kinase [Microgenomates group bacterium]
MRIFMIGPGGVGKSTVGKILAKNLGYQLIDLDEIFWSKKENKYLHTNFVYEKYCTDNSKLFYELLNTSENNCVFALSSGFLVYKDLANLHKKTITKEGISVLLLPSPDIIVSRKIIISRQMNRGLKLENGREGQKVNERFYKYQRTGDIKMYSHDAPEIIAKDIEEKLVKYI